jgi:type IV pilus assembly protein PilC
MAVYTCKVRDHRGEAFIKTMTGASAVEVRNKLREMGYMIVTPVTEARANRLSGVESLRNSRFARDLEAILSAGAKVSLMELTIFTRQFSTMINSGVALVRALTILSEQARNPALRRVINDMRTRVEGGASLADSMAKHPTIFDKLYVGMVRAGEAGGVLDAVLLRVAGFLEASAKLQGEVKGAMTMPLVVAFVAVAVFVAMLVFLLPIFAKMFESMNAKLPAYTQFLIDLSNTLRGPLGIGLFLMIGGTVVLFRRWAATDWGKHFIDRYILKVPIIGPVAQKVAVARFTRTLGTLLKSGVPLLAALEIVRDSSGNMVVSGALEDVRQAVREGDGIAPPLMKSGVFPSMVTQMISVGEETGQVDAMLEKVADFYDEEAQVSIQALASLIEPLMMVGVAVLVGSIVMGMYLPVFTIMNAIK